jgi:acyl carrier protein
MKLIETPGGKYMQDTFDLVVNEIAATMDTPISSLRADTSLAQIGMDSLQALQLLVSLEQALHIQLNEEDLKQFSTVQSIVDLVNNRCGQAAA